jgi:phospholipid transport system transporter-binding protein
MIVRQGNRYLIDGPITLDTVGGLVSEDAIFEGDHVIVDLERVTSADSSALALMMEWVRRHGDRHIAFANMSQNLLSLAELYGMIGLIPLAPD